MLDFSSKYRCVFYQTRNRRWGRKETTFSVAAGPRGWGPGQAAGAPSPAGLTYALAHCQHAAAPGARLGVLLHEPLLGRVGETHQQQQGQGGSWSPPFRGRRGRRGRHRHGEDPARLHPLPLQVLIGRPALAMAGRGWHIYSRKTASPCYGGVGRQHRAEFVDAGQACSHLGFGGGARNRAGNGEEGAAFQ